MSRRDRIYRKAEPAMWSSADFRALSAAPPNGQTLWWWLLSCERTIAIPGVVVARIAVIADDLRWPVRATRKILLEQIVASGMAEVDEEAGLVVLTKALLVNGDVRDTARPTSINQGKSWGTAFAALPRCALRDRLGDRLVEFFRVVGGEIANAFAETSCLPSARHAVAKPVAKSDGKEQGERTQESETESEEPESLSHHARGEPEDIPGRTSETPPARGPDSILALVTEAAAALTAARLEIDPEALPVDDSTAGAVVTRLASTPVADRRRRMMHAVACAVARSKVTRTVDVLRWSTFGSPDAWTFVQGASVEEYARQPRASPRGGAGPPRVTGSVPAGATHGVGTVDPKSIPVPGDRPR